MKLTDHARWKHLNWLIDRAQMYKRIGSEKRNRARQLRAINLEAAAERKLECDDGREHQPTHVLVAHRPADPRRSSILDN